MPQSSFTQQEQFFPDLGALCHIQNDGGVPACVITSLNYEEILLSSRGNWVLDQVEVYVQRFWPVSTVTLDIMSSSADPNIFWQSLPKIDKQIGKDVFNLPLQPEDEICVWLGFIDSLRPVTSEDLKAGRLLRKFVGVVDTISTINTDRGERIRIQARDRMRYLTDTQVTLQAEYLKGSSTDFNAMAKALKPGSSTGSTVARSDLILKVAQLGVGYIEQIDETGKLKNININGLNIKRGEVQDIEVEAFGTKLDKKSLKDGELVDKVQGPSYFYIGRQDNKTTPPLKTKTKTENLKLESDFKFNIQTGRLGFNLERLDKNYNIEDQVVIEFIRFLSNAEPYPTEIFCDPGTGDLFYAPRANDAYGLFKPEFFFRTYYYKTTPSGIGSDLNSKDLTSEALGETMNMSKVFAKIDFRQRCFKFKEDFSSIALKTNFIFSNTSPNKSGGSSKPIVLHGAMRPSWLRGRKIGGRNYFIIDETVNSVAEATAVLASMARIHAKELKAASMVVVGDPTLDPGQIVQVVGSPFYSDRLSVDQLIEDRKTYLEYESANSEWYVGVLEAQRQAIGSASPKKDQSFDYYGTIVNQAAPNNKSTSNEDKDDWSKLVAQPFAPDNAIDALKGITDPKKATIVRPKSLTDATTNENPTTPSAENTVKLNVLQTKLTITKNQIADNNANLQRDSTAINTITILVKQQAELEAQIKVLSPTSNTNSAKSSDGTENWNDEASGNPTWRTSGFAEEPKTMWRIEGVKHIFKSKPPDAGYSCEVVLLSPFT